MKEKTIEIGSDFSGVGALIQALKRLKFPFSEIFACDKDPYARQAYEIAYGKQQYFPEDVYDRIIPEKPLDLYVTSPPCQAFSLAGKRLGKLDLRGILFFNSLEFIEKNRPRYFIFENVKGLLSHDKDKKNKKAKYGKTFSEWINFLGGKSVNGAETIFPYQDSVPYHIYFQVINAKHCGVPQNRERVFIIGIRDDADNNFIFPPKITLEKRLRDILENSVLKKYDLSPEMIDSLIKNCNPEKMSEEKEGIMKLGYIGQDTQSASVHLSEGISPSLISGTHGYAMGYVVPEPMIGAIRGRNPENPKSREKSETMQQMLEINEAGISNAFTTVQKDNVVVMPAEIIQINDPLHSNDRVYSDQGISPTLNTMQGGNRQPFVKITDPKVVQMNPSKESGGKQPQQQNRVYDADGISPAVLANLGKGNIVFVKENTKKGYSEASEGDSINMKNLKSKTRRGTVQKEMSSALDTDCNQAVIVKDESDMKPKEIDEKYFFSEKMEDYLEKRKDNFNSGKINYKTEDDVASTLTKSSGSIDISDNIIVDPVKLKIRRLTPRECFRLMDFHESFMDDIVRHNVANPKSKISDSQLYKMAGNSIVVACFVALINRLNFN